jgi:hypothetical protein
LGIWEQEEVIIKMRLTYLFAAVIFVAVCIGIYMHEQVHVGIFQDYGINTTVHYFKYFPSVATVPDAPCPDSNCELSNEINEAVGYNTDWIFFMLALGLLIIIGLLEEK